MEPVQFRWEGASITAAPGDTVASALYRAGVRTFTHSYEYGRPRGLLCLTGSCPNCMVNVDGVPNVRSCSVPARNGLVVLPQNQNVYRGLDAPLVKRFAPAPPLSETEQRYEHLYLPFDVVVVGGGRSGVAAALAAADGGKHVALLEKESSLRSPLAYAGVTVYLNCSAFGLYEGNLLGAVQIDHAHANRETLLHLRAAQVVVATGAYETQLLFANNDLPGIMLSSAVLRLVRQHNIVPGKRAVLVGEPARAHEIAPELAAAGIEIVASLTATEVVRAEGQDHVSAVVTETATYPADLMVLCGPRVPDVSLLAQARTPLFWSQDAGAFLAEGLPPTVTQTGAAAGQGVANTQEPLSASAVSTDAIACLCMDVTGHDVSATIAAGMGHIELIKRFTKLGKSACQGRMCQTAAVHLCAHITGRTAAEVGTTVARPPAPPVTLGALAGMRHHPVRRTPMHDQHAALGAVWMDMGPWKRPRYYRRNECSLPQACIEQEYHAVRERAGIIDVSTLGKLEVKGADAGALLDLIFTHQFSTLPMGRARYSVMCDELGTILDDGTISRLEEQRYFLTTTTGNVDFVQQSLEWAACGGMQVTITNLTAGLASINLAGPAARQVLSRLTDCDVTPAAFPYMTCQQAVVAGIPATMIRLGFVGEVGWEITVAAEYGSYLWQQLLQAGADVDLRPFGVEAQRVLRLEKKHVIVGVDTDGLSNPYEAGMGWVAKLSKPDFVGRTALARLRKEPLERTLAGFHLEAATAPPDGSAVLSEGKAVGFATSVRYSWHAAKVVGLAWLPPALARQGTSITLRADGIDYPATVVEEGFYDPAGERQQQ